MGIILVPLWILLIIFFILLLVSISNIKKTKVPFFIFLILFLIVLNFTNGVHCDTGGGGNNCLYGDGKYSLYYYWIGKL